MPLLGRREFLSLIPGSLAVLASNQLRPLHRLNLSHVPQSQVTDSSSANLSCWLDVCAPFIVEDNQHGIHTEIFLTSDTFVGKRGYEDGADATDYEIYLYDSEGRPIGTGGIARRLMVPAMRTTVLRAEDLIGANKDFWGGMKIRMRLSGREPMPISDLFSSAFVRWQTEASFDNVHANPDPLQWQRADSFYYSMPFPPLAEYFCTFALFNPYGGRSAGQINLFDRAAKKALTKRYELKPYSSLLLNLNSQSYTNDPIEAFGLANGRRVLEPVSQALESGGLLAITNDPETVKSFGYLLIKSSDHQRFSVEHPIHQSVSTPASGIPPFDQGGNFKAKNVLYSPLVFRAKHIGPITLDSRFYLGTGLPPEQTLWLYPFVTNTAGGVEWQIKTDPKIPRQFPPSTLQRGMIRLETEQSCLLDFGQLSLKENFSGGLSLAVAPDISHTLMKVEVRVPEWGAHAFTHFRPGLHSARGYQKPKQRGGIATDYITSGARLQSRRNELRFDELIGVMNIDDRAVEGRPVLELFTSSGLLTRIPLGSIAGFACRHYLLSNLADASKEYGPLTLRLLDEEATLLMSILHIDYGRRDIALDHGSDRFSTLVDYGCNSGSK